jgi:YggT family protein
MDPFIVSLLRTIINIYLVILFIRAFMRESEQFDPVFDMIYKVTEPVIGPLGINRRAGQINLAPFIPIVILLLLKGMLVSSIPEAVLEFTDKIFQLYVLILIIITGFREYYTNPIANFGQRMVNPVRSLVANFSRRLQTVNLLTVLLLLALHIIVSFITMSFILPSFPLKSTVIRSLYQILNLIDFFTLVIILNAILSWFSPDPRNPAVQLLTLISIPIVEPIRKFMPALGGMIDISPLIAFFWFATSL